MTRTRIDNQQDVLDSRDILARIEELQGERDDYTYVCSKCDGTGWYGDAETGDPATYAKCDTCGGDGTVPDPDGWADENPHEAVELAALTALANEASGSPDWRYGETLIRDSYFEEYARELADDIGAIDHKAGWPARCIDWAKAADELKQDYFTVDFDGVDYWIRG